MLPSGWTEVTDDNGATYYHHTETGQTQWECPTPEGAFPGGLPSGWKELTDDNGKLYYHNSESGQTQWECPATEESAPSPPKPSHSTMNTTSPQHGGKPSVLPKPSPFSLDGDKDSLLLEAVEASNIMQVKQLIKFIDELELECVNLAYEEAQQKGNGMITRLIGNALKKIGGAEPTPPRGLPSGWTEHTNDNGATYYHHTESGQTQWECPTPEKKPPPPPLRRSSQAESRASTITEELNIRFSGISGANNYQDDPSDDDDDSASNSTGISPISRSHGYYSGDSDDDNTHSVSSVPPDATENNKKFKLDFEKNHCSFYQQENDLRIMKIKFEKKFDDPEIMFQQFSIGSVNYNATKSILLVGATGAGKTSLISSIINRAYGIKFEDNFRIKIEEEDCQGKTSEQSQTEWISVYTINTMPGMSIPYNLRIIDTPGLNDTRGLHKDREMFTRLEKVLRMEEYGVDEIHSIGIVTMASAVRLTAGQMYVYDGCMRLFGRDVKHLINIMATYADNSEPAIKNGLKAAGVEYVQMHKFNNSSVFLSNNINDRDTKKMNLYFWKLMEKSCEGFLSFIGNAAGQSLTLTVETLKSRRVIQENLSNIQSNFLENLDNALFSFKPKKVNCKGMAFNCSRCISTCHTPCPGLPTCGKCEELSEGDGKCSACGCPYREHKSAKKYTYVIEKKEMRKKKMMKMLKSMRELKECVKKLQEVALLPNAKPMDSYIDSLIEENGQNPSSTKEKLEVLERIKQEEKNMHLILENECDLEKLTSIMEEKCAPRKGWIRNQVKSVNHRLKMFKK